MNSRTACLLVGLGILALGAPSDAQFAAPADPAGFHLPANAIPGAQAPDLRIGPGDVLDISVFDSPELDQSIRIDNNGEAAPKFLSSLHLAGLTVPEAEHAIENAHLQSGFLLNPKVTIVISEYATQGASVLGEVEKPGVYPVFGSRKLLDLISAASGLSPAASHEATIQRKTGESIQVSFTRRADDMLAANVLIYPGDTVIIPKAGIFYVLGDVGRPGNYLMDDGGRVSVLQALATAGGINRTAAQNQMFLIRRTSSGTENIRVEFGKLVKGTIPDPQLQPDDVLYVRPSVVKAVLEHVPTVLQSAAAGAEVYTIAP